MPTTRIDPETLAPPVMNIYGQVAIGTGRIVAIAGPLRRGVGTSGGRHRRGRPGSPRLCSPPRTARDQVDGNVVDTTFPST